MKKIKIKVMCRHTHEDLVKEYEQPNQEPCEMRIGDEFIVENAMKPEHFCNNAWKSLKPYVETLANGGGKFFGDWMKNEHSAMVCCDDGFRPVTYYIEAID